MCIYISRQVCRSDIANHGYELRLLVSINPSIMLVQPEKLFLAVL